MKDAEIRESFHKKVLGKRASRNTLILDELGLMHGACRADIAVVNGRLIGYEIKSNADSLARLKTQVPAYDAIFDRITVIVGERYRNAIARTVPRHWGIILSTRGKRGAIRFHIKRQTRPNQNIKPFSVAQLLWRNEVLEILHQLGSPSKLIKLPRGKLYRYLSRKVPLDELKRLVRQSLKKRTNWRCPSRPSSGGDLYRPIAKSSGYQDPQDARRTCGYARHPQSTFLP